MNPSHRRPPGRSVGQGIGKAAGLLFLLGATFWIAGAKVACIDVDEETLAGTVSAIEEAGGTIVPPEKAHDKGAGHLLRKTQEGRHGSGGLGLFTSPGDPGYEQRHAAS